MTDIVIYTDGSCQTNPGPGGWAAIIARPDTREEVELVGGEPSTTNNRMELMGAIAALESLTEPAHVKIVTDSQYVQKGATEWIYGWRLRNWRTAGGKPVLNQDLWERLIKAEAFHHFVDWEWVRGHNGHPFNERADALARSASMTACP